MKKFSAGKLGDAFIVLMLLATALYGLALFTPSIAIGPYAVLGLFGLLVAVAGAGSALVLEVNGKSKQALVFASISVGVPLLTGIINMGLPVVRLIPYFKYSPDLAVWSIITDSAAYFALAALIMGFISFRKFSAEESTEPAQEPLTSKAFARTGIAGAIIALIGLVITSLDSSSYDSSQTASGIFVFWVGIILVDIWVASLIAGYAQKRERSWTLFFWLSLIVSPIIPLIVVAAIEPARPVAGTPQQGKNSLNDQGIPGQIEKLGELRDKGLITEREFQQKKRVLLDRF